MTKDIVGKSTDQRGTLLSATGEFNDSEKRLVKEFFIQLKSIYGKGKYGAQFGTDRETEILAMKTWAPVILKHSDAHLADCLAYALETVTNDSFPCINTILKGRPKQYVHPSHRPMSDDQLMIPRSKCPGPLQVKKLIPRDTRGYPIEKPTPCVTVSNDELERRRQAIADACPRPDLAG